MAESEQDDIAIRHVRTGIWVYLILLLAEGSLRKWIFPSLSGPLLLVRDPVALWIYYCAFRAGMFPTKVGAALVWLGALSTIFSFLASFSADMSSPFVTLYGLRTNFLHVPLIFVVPAAFGEANVRRCGVFLLLIAAPMAVLMAAQYDASPDDVLNAGVGGGSQIRSVRGKIRPAGTFSYVTGIVAFFSIVMAFFVDGLLRRGRYPTLCLAGAAVALLIAMSVSGSRSVVLGLGLVLLAGLGSVLLAPWLAERVFRLAAVSGLALFVAMSTAVFGHGLSTLMDRFAVSGGQEGVTGRILASLATPFETATSVPLIGYGLGVGTMAGAAILVGRPEFLLAEDEWSRLLMECGPILGTIFVVMRLGLALWIFANCVRSAREHGNVLPLLLFAAVASNIIMGQWGQATIQGFTSIGAGLCLAACNIGVAEETPADDTETE
ncbi:MAG TPA: hypothetical protein VEJ63_16260 [Planctomycetota bacterium]|nr:hypothetical protein [Planctomycetota bacterium]